MVVRTIQSTQECYSFRLFGTCIITPGTLWIAIVRGTRKWVNMIFLEHVVSVTKEKNDSFSLNHCDEEVWGRSNPHRPFDLQSLVSSVVHRESNSGFLAWAASSLLRLPYNHQPSQSFICSIKLHPLSFRNRTGRACLPYYISFTKSVLYQLLLNHISCVRLLPMVYLTWIWNSLYSASAKPTLCVEGGVGRCTVNWVGRTQVEDNGEICSLG